MRVTLKDQKVRDFQNKSKNKYCGLSYWHNVELLFMSLLLSTYYWQTQELFLSCGFIQLKNLYYISTYICIYMYGSQAVYSTGIVQNQRPPLGKLTARKTHDSRTNWILPTAARLQSHVRYSLI